MSQLTQSDLTTQPNINYDDGPVTIDDPIVEYKTFEQVSWWRLKQMLERWPAMHKSWQAFIIDYLSLIHI